MGKIRLIEHLRFSYSLLKGRIVYLQPIKGLYNSFYRPQAGLTASLGYHLEGSLEGILEGISYIFSYIFYSSIKAITEAIYKWFHFPSTASV